MEQNLFKIRPIAQVAQEAVDYIDKRRHHTITSLKTRWNKFNQQCMGGIEPNAIYTMAGISGSGNKIFANCNLTDLFLR